MGGEKCREDFPLDVAGGSAVSAREGEMGGPRSTREAGVNTDPRWNRKPVGGMSVEWKIDCDRESSEIYFGSLALLHMRCKGSFTVG